MTGICVVRGCTTRRPNRRAIRCVKHGGGWRCRIPGCTSGARTKRGRLCVSHGGRRCRLCMKTERIRGMCRVHSKCKYPGCVYMVGADGRGYCCCSHALDYEVANTLLALRKGLPRRKRWRAKKKYCL